MKTVLHVGCGGSPIIDYYFDGWQEVRLDIDPAMKPDIVADMMSLGDIGPFDAIYTCHSLEHLYPHQVDVALREFLRVLKPDGVALIVVPDLEGVAINEDTLYESPAGPVSGLDMVYGMRSLIAAMPYMAHHSGFTAKTLEAAMRKAGFQTVCTRREEFYNLMAAGSPRKAPNADDSAQERSHSREDDAGQPEHDFRGAKGFDLAAS